jgi:Bacterial aa3 type cytochrome c oxidase subunit IV
VTPAPNSAIAGFAQSPQHKQESDMADYKHGSMDIKGQQKTFDGFMWFVSRGAILSILILIFMALVNA